MLNKVNGKVEISEGILINYFMKAGVDDAISSSRKTVSIAQAASAGESRPAF